MKPPVVQIKLFLLSTLIFASFFAIAQPKGGRSSITGQKFKTQSKIKKKKPVNYINSIKVVAGFGSATYFGDLCTGFDCVKLRPSVSLGLNYRISESLMIRGEVGYLKLTGSDVDGEIPQRNLSFKSDNIEAHVNLVYDFYHQDKMFRRRHLINPYVYLGIGTIAYFPKAELNGEYYYLRKLQTEGQKYGMFAMTVPYGAGLRFRVHPQMNVELEGGYRWTFTDYLDDVSTKYTGNYTSPEAAALADRRLDPNGELRGARPGGIRGNPASKDGYFIFNIKLDYTIKVTRQHYNINSNASRMRIINSLKKKEHYN